MAENKTPTSSAWTYVSGAWEQGNPRLIGAMSHAMWLGSTVFDGARWFDGVAPDLDLHCDRLNRSALAMGMAPTISSLQMQRLVWEGVKKFDGSVALYIRPMYWTESGRFGMLVPDPDSTEFALSIFTAAMPTRSLSRLTVSSYRKPSPESAITQAKAGCLYPNNGRIIAEAMSRGYDNALVLDMNGDVAETASSNVFVVRAGRVLTPAANGSFLAGITRARVIELLKLDGWNVQERTLSVDDFHVAEEIFTTGNFAKVSSVGLFDGRCIKETTVADRARDLYMKWAHADVGCAHFATIGER